MPSRTPIIFQFWVSGALVNATSVALSSPDSRFGLRRMDNLAVIIPAGLSVPNVSTGVYQLPNGGLQDPALGLVYEAIFQVVYNGLTYYHRRIFRGATANAYSASSADMVEILKCALRDNPGAILNVTVDGQTTEWSRAQAITELQFWERRVAREQGRRPIAGQFSMQF